MALGLKDRQEIGSPYAEINMIPLIDVMLVLLVIFIVAAPLLTHAVRIDLPRASSSPVTKASEAIALAIDAAGELYWNGERLAPGELAQHLEHVAQLAPQPELHLSVDRTAQYQAVAQTLAAASRAGLTRIGFIADPRVPAKP